MSLDINANLTYSRINGCTAINAPTAPGRPVEILHVPTKDQPYTDVRVTFRILGTVTIDAGFAENEQT
jgi:hypothetical protein